MRELTTYINEKLDINNVNLDEFPADGTIDEVVKFLKHNDFKVELDYDDAMKKYHSVFKAFCNEQGNRVFMQHPDGAWLRFAYVDGTPILYQNPIYDFIPGKFKNVYEKEFYDLYTGYYNSESISKSEFLRELNKHFKF